MKPLGASFSAMTSERNASHIRAGLVLVLCDGFRLWSDIVFHLAVTFFCRHSRGSLKQHLHLNPAFLLPVYSCLH